MDPTADVPSSQEARHFHFGGQQQQVHVHAESGDAGACDSTGLTVWPAGLALCEYLVENPGLVKDCRLLELGCGAGLPSLLALALGAASVTFSDREQPVLHRMRRSADLNGFSQAAFQLYDWEQPRSLPGSWVGAWRLVIATDVVYASRTARPLAAALRLALHPGEGVALVAHQERRAVSLDPATRLPRVEDRDEPWELFRAACRAEGLRERVLAQVPTTSPVDEGFMCILALAPSEAALEAAVGLREQQGGSGGAGG